MRRTWLFLVGRFDEASVRLRGVARRRLGNLSAVDVAPNILAGLRKNRSPTMQICVLLRFKSYILPRPRLGPECLNFRQQAVVSRLYLFPFSQLTQFLTADFAWQSCLIYFRPSVSDTFSTPLRTKGTFTYCARKGRLHSRRVGPCRSNLRNNLPAQSTHSEFNY